MVNLPDHNNGAVKYCIWCGMAWFTEMSKICTIKRCLIIYGKVTFISNYIYDM